MNLLNLLDQKIDEARKTKNSFSLGVFSTFKGEVQNQLKLSNKTSDDLIQSYALKSEKNLTQFKPLNWELELKLLEPFLPKKLSEEDLINEIDKIISNNKDVPTQKLLGLVMKSLKGADINLVKKLLKIN